MADNTELNQGTGGDVIATDDISGVKHQRVKIEYGDDGEAIDVSSINPLPVSAGGSSATPLTYVTEGIAGFIPIHKVARRVDFSGANGLVSGYNGITTTGRLTSSPDTVRIASGGSGSDDSTSSGAQYVRVYGLDNQWNWAWEDLKLKGVSVGDDSVNSYRRINFFEVVSTGTVLSSNVGDITLEWKNSTVDIEKILVGENQAMSGMFSVPTGYNAYLTNIVIHVNQTEYLSNITEETNYALGADIRLKALYPSVGSSSVGTGDYPPVHLVSEWHGVRGSHTITPQVPLVFPAQSDFWFECGDVSGDDGNSSVTINYDIMLWDGAGGTDWEWWQ